MDFMNGIFQKTRHNDLDYALQVLSEKNKVLSKNIANADTPMYKAKKLEFDEVMAEYYGGGKKTKLYVTHPMHMQPGEQRMYLTNGRHMIAAMETPSNIQGHIRNQNNPSLRTDGNDVNIDYEMSEQANTSILYSMLTQVTGGKFGSLKEIIRTP